MKRIVAILSFCFLVISFSLTYGADSSAGTARTTPQGAVRAWIYFDKGGESYAGIPYLWLGDCAIELTIDVKPGPGLALDFLWGSKDDQRFAELTVNGKKMKVIGGGYDGFRWKRVPLPKGIHGNSIKVKLSRTMGKPAFFAAVCVTDPAGKSVPMKGAVHKIILKTTDAMGQTGPQGREAFPEMQQMWDTPFPHPAPPAEDPEEEKAYRRAEQHGRQANEMFFRSKRFVDGWLAFADPHTGLIPRNLTSGITYWNAKDSAADNYPFMVLTCALTDRAMFNGRMHDMLKTEIKVTSRIDRMPDTYSFTKKGFQADEPNLDGIIFGSSEYIKDGLLPLTEWLGPSPWCDRMIGILDDMWKHAPYPTAGGKIVSKNFEVNGEMLQVLSRIYWMTGDAKYLEWAMRLGDYYLLGDQHPTRNFTSLSLDDHGCEAISGLCELYAALHFARPEKKKEYKAPLYAMLDRILECGRTSYGLFYNRINPQKGTHVSSLTDNWGYNLNGFYTVYLVDGKKEYRRAVIKALENLYGHYLEYRWEGGCADGYADSIEGAINLYNRERVDAAVPWIDSEIHDMWHKQRPGGIIEGWHGDGNVARTAMMYALMKTQGLHVRGWRKDLRFGAVEKGRSLFVSMAADEDWKGTLHFDIPRHKVNMHMPIDWPRINQFPEWFTVEAEKKYQLEGIGTFTGAELSDGIAISVKGGKELRIKVQKR